MLVSLAYDGHLRNVSNLPLDVFVSFSVTSATELPADTFLVLTLDRWGRRWMAFGTLGLSGVLSVLTLLVAGELVLMFRPRTHTVTGSHMHSHFQSLTHSIIHLLNSSLN